MPAQLISQPNPPPDPSLLPDSLLDYAVKLNIKGYLPQDELQAIRLFRDAADYIAAGTRILCLSRIRKLIDLSYDLLE